MIRKTSALLAFLYMFFISWTDAFSISEWIRLPIVLSLGIVFVSFFSISLRKISLRSIKPEDIFIVLMLVGLLVSAIVNINSKSLNYLAAYFFVFGVLYLLMKVIVYNTVEWDSLLKANTFGVLFVALFAVIDFSLWYFLGFDIQDVIPRTREASAVYSSLFRRSYGFTTEPTILAFYFNTLGIIGIWYLWSAKYLNKLLRLLLTIVFILALVSTFSSAGLVGLFFGVIVSFASQVITKKLELNIKNILISIISIIIVISSLNYIGEYLIPIMEKATLQEGASSDRINNWKWGIQQFENNPIFGIGLGASSAANHSGAINWYLMLSAEGGIISIGPMLLFLLITFYRLLKTKIPGKFWFLVSFLAGSIHFIAISTFFHPFLWTLLILFHCHRYVSLKSQYAYA